MSRHRQPRLSLPTRLTASLGAALVLVLTILAVSPTLHAWLHAEPVATSAHAACGHDHGTRPAPAPLADHDHRHADDAGCIVTLFSHGGSELAVAPALLSARPLAFLGDTLPLSVFCAPSAPAYLLPPCCGPPLV